MACDVVLSHFRWFNDSRNNDIWRKIEEVMIYNAWWFQNFFFKVNYCLFYRNERKDILIAKLVFLIKLCILSYKAIRIHVYLRIVYLLCCGWYCCTPWLIRLQGHDRSICISELVAFHISHVLHLLWCDQESRCVSNQRPSLTDESPIVNMRKYT